MMRVNLNVSEPGATLRPSAPNPRLEPSCTAFHYYLELVCRPLRGVAPEPWIEDLRAELSGHLDSLLEAYEELGEEREAATAHACRHLGDPELLGAGWAAHWEDKRIVPFRHTVGLAFRYFAVSGLASTAMFLMAMSPYMFGLPHDILAFWGVLIMPIHTGILFGMRSRGRRGPATAVAILLLTGVIALLGAILPGPDSSGLRPFLWMSTLIYTLPIGTAAAAITGRLRDRKRRRARLAG